MKKIIILLIIISFFNSPFCLGQQEQIPLPEEGQVLTQTKLEGEQAAFEPVLKIEKTEENLFSIELRDVEIVDLVRVLAYEYKLNIVLDKDVKGKVTASFYNIKLEEALEKILSIQGYSFVKEDNTYRVKRALQSRVFKLNYASVNSVLGKSKEGKQVSGGEQAAGGGQVSGGEQKEIYSLLSKEGKILYGEEPNAFLVIDYPENISQIENYIKVIDVRPAQVLVEARVVEVKLQKEHALGVNWRLFADKGGFKVGQFRVGSTYPGVPGPLIQSIDYKPTYYPPGVSAGEEEPFTLAIFDDNINVVLKALATSLDTNILSAPSVTTLNNHEAEIKIIQSLPWAEPEVAVSGESGTVTVTWTIHFEEVGIILKVTPIINEDGKIIMVLNPEVSESTSDYELKVVQGETEVPYKVPVIDKRSASTKVVIGNGQTLIIGGLIKDKTTKGATKVPVLGDIPLLGYLFKSTKSTKDKTELLIFVSPTIITPDEYVRMARQERYGVGKGYLRERERQAQMWAALYAQEKARKDKLLLRLDLLEKRQEELVSKRKTLEEEVIKGEEDLKALQNKGAETIK